MRLTLTNPHPSLLPMSRAKEIKEINCMKVVHLLIFGKVHGVGFRNFIKHNARKRGLVGWVRNLPEGNVEAELAGPEKAIEQLVLLAKKGPFLAEVTDVQVSDVEKDFPYQDFVLRHDEE